MDVWLNGKFVPAHAAQVSIFDSGLQHAIGVFDTAIAANGQVFRAEQHVRRLVTSAIKLGLSKILRVDPLVRAMNLTLQHNQLTEARLRLTLTAGDARLRVPAAEIPDPTIFIAAQPPTIYPDSYFENGVTVTISDDQDNPASVLAGHKTLSYWARIRALQIAAREGAAESLWFSVTQQLVSGSVSNIFLVSKNRLSTSVARGEQSSTTAIAPALPGITRHVVRELASEMDIPVEIASLTIEDVLAADEIFLTNSSWGVLPVVRVEDRTIGSGLVGPLTRELRRLLLHRIQLETLSPPGFAEALEDPLPQR